MMLIRPARDEDVDAIARVVDHAYEQYVERIGRSPAPMVDDYALKLHDARVLVAEERAVIGVIVFLVNDDHVLVENVAVEPSHQGHGVGRALLVAAERYAAELGVSELRLYTNAAMTENLAFYARLAYVQVDRRVEDGFDRVYFSKRLPTSGQSDLREAERSAWRDETVAA